MADTKQVEEMADTKQVEEMADTKQVEEMADTKQVEEMADTKQVEEMADTKQVGEPEKNQEMTDQETTNEETKNHEVKDQETTNEETKNHEVKDQETKKQEIENDEIIMETLPTKKAVVEVAHEDNFWMEGNYKKVVKRIEDGARSVDDLSKMIKERAEIEQLYATKLKAWSKKWIENNQKMFEYNTAERALKRGFSEADSLADLHISISSKLEGLSKQISQWKNSTYPKSLTRIKEAKRSEDAFIKAQKPWTVKYNEVYKSMTSYHNAHSNRDAAEQASWAAENRSDISPEQKKKLKDKITKFEEEIKTTHGVYQEAIRDISNYNYKYKDDMHHEFAKCQQFETSRKEYLKQRLVTYQACIDRTIFHDNYEIIYKRLSEDYCAMNVEEDLQWFKSTHGDDHPFTTVVSIEYDAKQHSNNNNSVNPAAPSETKKSGVCTTL